MEGSDYYEEPLSTNKDFIPTPLPTHESGKERPAGTIKVEHGIVIDLPLTSLSKRKVTELKECYLVLYEHFVVYKIVAQYEALDNNTETWDDFRGNYRWTKMRADLSDVSMFYDNGEKLWGVEIEFGKNAQTWYYEKGADAKKFYDVMQNYFVTRDQKI